MTIHETNGLTQSFELAQALAQASELAQAPTISWQGQSVPDLAHPTTHGLLIALLASRDRVGPCITRTIEGAWVVRSQGKVASGEDLGVALAKVWLLLF